MHDVRFRHQFARQCIFPDCRNGDETGKLVLSLSMRQGPAYVAATSRPDSSLRRATATRIGFSGNSPTKRLITSHADGGAGHAGQRQVAGDGIRVALDRFLRHGRRCASRRGDRFSRDLPGVRASEVFSAALAKTPATGSSPQMPPKCVCAICAPIARFIHCGQTQRRAAILLFGPSPATALTACSSLPRGVAPCALVRHRFLRHWVRVVRGQQPNFGPSFDASAVLNSAMRATRRRSSFARALSARPSFACVAKVATRLSYHHN